MTWWYKRKLEAVWFFVSFRFAWICETLEFWSLPFMFFSAFSSEKVFVAQQFLRQFSQFSFFVLKQNKKNLQTKVKSTTKWDFSLDFQWRIQFGIERVFQNFALSMSRISGSSFYTISYFQFSPVKINEKYAFLKNYIYFKVSSLYISTISKYDHLLTISSNETKDNLCSAFQRNWISKTWLKLFTLNWIDFL